MSKPETPARPRNDDTLQLSQTIRDLTGMVMGDFRVERLLGRGGMGEVYLARQVSLDRPVALKVLKPDLLANSTSQARFESEAWAAAKLNHPNIVHIYTVGTFEGLRFIAMEYVQGTNLKEYLTKRGVPELPLALSIMKQAAQGVGAAGEVGLVHRDIKPENLLLTKKGQVKIADFGLCRATDADQVHLTQTGVTLGTPLYMSPEQVQGHTMDHRSDLYSLGVTFYHMLTGLPPFKAETPLALALKHVREKPIHLAVHRPDLPKELTSLVMRLMEKDPTDRYQSAAELLRDISKIRDSLNVSAQTVPVTANVTTAPDAPAPRKTETLPRSRKLPSLNLGFGTIAAIAAVMLLLGAGLGYFARSQDLLSPSAPPPTGAPALWMANWQEIKKERNAEAQYRRAQTHPGNDDPEALWLAVPGYFRDAHDWARRSYTQLARLLLRQKDSEHLEALAADLARSQREYDRALAQVASIGVAVLNGDREEFVPKVGNLKFDTMPPEMAELALETIQIARHDSSLSSVDRTTLNRTRNQILSALRLELVNQFNILKVE